MSIWNRIRRLFTNDKRVILQLLRGGVELSAVELVAHSNGKLVSPSIYVARDELLWDGRIEKYFSTDTTYYRERK